LASQVENQVFHRRRRAVCVAGNAWPVVPIDAIEASACGASDPVLDRGQRNAELASDSPQGQPAADSGDHVPTTLGSGVFFVIAFSPEGAVSVNHSSAVTGMYCHSTDRDVLSLAPLSLRILMTVERLILPTPSFFSPKMRVDPQAFSSASRST